MAEKVKNVYEFDYERTKSRVDLILESFKAAPDVDQELLAHAAIKFQLAFTILQQALDL